MERSMERSTNSGAVPRTGLKIGLVTEPFSTWPLERFTEWLVREAPTVTDLEVGAGGYALPGHCDTPVLLRDRQARRTWLESITGRGLRLGALNVSGNPLHPDP